MPLFLDVGHSCSGWQAIDSFLPCLVGLLLLLLSHVNQCRRLARFALTHFLNLEVENPSRQVCLLLHISVLAPLPGSDERLLLSSCSALRGLPSPPTDAEALSCGGWGRSPLGSSCGVPVTFQAARRRPRRLRTACVLAVDSSARGATVPSISVSPPVGFLEPALVGCVSVFRVLRDLFLPTLKPLLRLAVPHAQFHSVGPSEVGASPQIVRRSVSTRTVHLAYPVLN